VEKRTLDVIVVEDGDNHMLKRDDESIKQLILKYIAPINGHHAELNRQEIVRGGKPKYQVPAPFSVIHNSGQAITYTKYNPETGEITSKPYQVGNHRKALGPILDNLDRNLEHAMFSNEGPKLLVLSHAAYTEIMASRDSYRELEIGLRIISPTSLGEHWQERYNIKPYFLTKELQHTF
jgi:hypothetical protein